MKINCGTHGEVQATPDKNGNAFCSDCYRWQIQRFTATMNWLTTYATSSIGYDPAIRQLVRKMADPFFRAMTRDEYVKANLADEMRKHRGKKRLRKKKAKAALRMRWGLRQLGQLVSRRVNYSAIGRRLFSVEPLPYPAIPIYGKDTSVLDVVTGGEV